MGEKNNPGVAGKRYRVFVGSSSEISKVADQLVAHFHSHPLLTFHTWRSALQGNKSTLEKLLDQTKKCDFAVFVYGPDDFVQSRGRDSHAPRDNVVLEHGLFAGALGRDRVFYMVPKGVDIKVCTDLLGQNHFQYDMPTPEQLDAGQVDIEAVGIGLENMMRQVLSVGSVVDRFVAAVAELSETLGKLARVTYLGKFPHFIGSINRCLLVANEQVRISCDTLMYGHFSAHAQYQQYKEALKTLKADTKRNINIAMIVLDQDGSREMREKQFGTVESPQQAQVAWAKLCSDKAFAENLRQFESRSGRVANLTEFFEKVLELEIVHVNDFKKDVVDQLRSSSLILPVNFWLVDNSQAVFSFAAQGPGTVEHAFHTTDPSLINSFEGMWNSRLEKSTVL